MSGHNSICSGSWHYLHIGPEAKLVNNASLSSHGISFFCSCWKTILREEMMDTQLLLGMWFSR